MHVVEDGLSNDVSLQVVVVRHCFLPEVDIAATKPEIIIPRVAGHLAEKCKQLFSRFCAWPVQRR